MRRLAAACALVLASGCGRGRVPPSSSAMPDFAMTAVGPEREAPFGRRDLLGRVWVADFVFTHCSGPCPLLSERLAKLAAALPPEVGILTVTVDPETDTPARLRAYAKAYGADLRRWVFLRGTVPQTYELMYSGFRLPISVDPKSEAGSRVMHSTRFVLLDKKAAVRGYYDGLDDLGNDALARDARRLLEGDS